MTLKAKAISVDDVLAACEGAYSICTTKGYSADLRIFVNWCIERDALWLPAAPAIVAAFIDDQVTRYRISTIKRRLCAIGFAHRMRDLPTPTSCDWPSDAQPANVSVVRSRSGG